MSSVLACLLLSVSVASGAGSEQRGSALQWEALPDLPNPLGVAGPFAGVNNDALIVAGGANFPEGMPWELRPDETRPPKVWWDDIFVLEEHEGGHLRWQEGYRLPRPLAYGASITTPDADGVICLGGCDAERCYPTVFRLRWANGKIEQTTLPDLPKPCAFMGAATVGSTIYVAGGQDSTQPSAALKTLWALDLASAEPRWEELDPWPGPARILPVAAAQGGAFYLVSGAELVTGPDGEITRRYLTDAYRFRPGEGWHRIADVPRPVVAAPALACGPSHILVFGGDDGANADRALELKDGHPGFSRTILAYHTITDTWAATGTLPAGLVTTTAVPWEDRIVIPSGEDRPGHRSPAVYQARPAQSTAHFGLLDYAAVGTYLAALVLMGLYFSRREKSTADFFLAGRRVPWWAAGLSIFGTQLSAITFMAIPAKTYATNWVYFLGNVCILLIAPAVVYLYLPFFRRLNVTTAYEYLERRFSVAVRLFGSSAFILYQLGRMGIVLCLPAIALSAATGISIYACILVMGVLCTVYTVLGGIEAVIWTDVLQVIVLMGGAILSVLIIAGGVQDGLAGIVAVGQAEAKFHTFDWTWDITTTAVWVVVVGNLLGNLVPYTTDQTVVQRYLTTRDEKQAARSIWTNAVLAIPASALFFGLGTALFAFYRARPELLNPALKTDAIFPWFVAQQLPAGVSGLVIAGVFAASMSSLDSSMNSVSAAMVTDFYRRFSLMASEHSCLKLARWLTAILGVVATGAAILIAWYDMGSLWDLFIKVLGLFGGSLAGLFILGIFTRRARGHGALVGAVASAVVLFLVQRHTQIHFFLYAAVGIFTCVAVGYVVSMVLPGDGRSLEGLTIFTMQRRSDSQ
ncbi:MAG: sodium/solute symporter [Armatimonadota bacterium]